MSTFSAVLFATACFLISGSAGTDQRTNIAGAAHQTVTPRWHTNIESVIDSEPIGEVFGRGKEYKALPLTSLWFTDNNTGIASFVTREGQESPRLSQRGVADATLPLRVRVVLLNATTGKVIRTLNLPSESRNARIIAVHDGQFVVQAGGELTLYGSDLTAKINLALPSLNGRDWIPHPSLSGKNILFLPPGHGDGPWIWMETPTLRILHSWKDTENGNATVSDDAIAMITCTWSHDCEPKLEVRGIDTNWRIIGPADRHENPQFVADDLLLLSGRSPRLIRTSGELVLAEDLKSRGCWWGKAFPATAGKRFVVPSCVVQGAIGSADVAGRAVLKNILVYDEPFDVRTYTLDIKGPIIKNLTLLAIAPDGSQLAILNGDFMEIFQLPPRLGN